MYRLVMNMLAGETEARMQLDMRVFRPYKLYTDLKASGVASIDGIYMGDIVESLLIGSVDAWEFSGNLANQLRAEFFKEHGLVGKSTKYIQRYLDRNLLSLPDVGKLDLPTLSKGQIVRITGQFPEPCAFTLWGIGP